MTGLFGERFERFENPSFRGCELIEPLGQGGHSRVFLARRRGEEVAIKQWLRPRLDKKERRRIKREVETLKSLDHPHIVRYLGLTQDERGRPCLVMDYVPGRSLAAALDAEGPLEAERVQVIALALVKTLRYLAARGVVHRDIKPDNVILRSSLDTPVLVDFSVARSADDDDAPTLTATGASVGTAPYMAPEQFGGKRAPVDARTDIYGLGALLFHCVAGLPPWSRESAWERQQRNPWTEPYPTEDDKATRVRTAAAATPKALARIIQTCLQGDPDARFQSPEELERALLGWIDGPARRRQALQRLTRVAAGALALTLVFILGFVARPWLAAEPKPPEREAAPDERAERRERPGGSPAEPADPPAATGAEPRAVIARPEEYFIWRDGEDRLFDWRQVWPAGALGKEERRYDGLERWSCAASASAPELVEVTRAREGIGNDLRYESGRSRFFAGAGGYFEIEDTKARRLASFPLRVGDDRRYTTSEELSFFGETKQVEIQVELSVRRRGAVEAVGRRFEDCLVLVEDVQMNGELMLRTSTTYARGFGVVAVETTVKGGAKITLSLKEYKPGT